MQQLQQPKQGYKLVNTQFPYIRQEVPEEWNFSKVSDITHLIQSGISRLLSPSDIGYVMLTSQNISDGKLDTSDVKYWYKIDNQGVDLTKYILDEGDILLNFINSIKQIGKSCIFRKQGRDWIFTTNVFRIKTDQTKVNHHFLQLVLQSDLIQKQIRAITQPAINQASFSKRDLNKLVVCYPTLEEQQKIASIISKVDELIQKTDQVIEQTQILKKGLMQRLLTKGIGHSDYYQTEIGKTPIEWQISTIGKECKVGTGGTPSRNKLVYFKGDIPWIKTAEIDFNLITNSEEYINQQALEDSAAKVYPKGTLLMAMYGQGVTRGKCAILGIDAAINQACAAIQSLGKMDIQFIFYWCQWQYNNIRNKSQGTHQSNFNLEFVRAIKIPCPTLLEQKRIVIMLSNMDSIIEKKHNYRTKLVNLKKGLMQKLLTGKIRVRV